VTASAQFTKALGSTLQRKSRNVTLASLNVFINCPFDNEYKRIFEVLRFTVQACGYLPRCALEESDGADIRINKIYKLMKESDRSIHDLSRTELSPTGLPRFNMPFELGLFMGAKKFGGVSHRAKTALIMIKRPYVLPKYLSDLGGSDPGVHRGNNVEVIRLIREYLSVGPLGVPLPGPKHLADHYKEFKRDLPRLLGNQNLS
jgi:hypothetical protein